MVKIQIKNNANPTRIKQGNIGINMEQILVIIKTGYFHKT